MKALVTFSLMATLGTISAASVNAQAVALIGGKTVANSCEIVMPFKFKRPETAALEAKGYRVIVKRSAYKYDRFLGQYNYYELKDSHLELGALSAKVVLAPHSRSGLLLNGSDGSVVAAREFTINLAMPYGFKAVGVAMSTPPGLEHSNFESSYADFSSFPDCHE